MESRFCWFSMGKVFFWRVFVVVRVVLEDIFGVFFLFLVFGMKITVVFLSIWSLLGLVFVFFIR